jgi:hypothetical protein
MSSGVPTPIRYLALFSGRAPAAARAISYISGFSSPTLRPPTA